MYTSRDPCRLTWCRQCQVSKTRVPAALAAISICPAGIAKGALKVCYCHTKTLFSTSTITPKREIENQVFEPPSSVRLWDSGALSRRVKGEEKETQSKNILYPEAVLALVMRCTPPTKPPRSVPAILRAFGAELTSVYAGPPILPTSWGPNDDAALRPLNIYS